MSLARQAASSGYSAWKDWRVYLMVLSLSERHDRIATAVNAFDRAALKDAEFLRQLWLARSEGRLDELLRLSEAQHRHRAFVGDLCPQASPVRFGNQSIQLPARDRR